MSAIGGLIRRLREGRGLTLTRLAELSGCTKGYLSQIETGRRGGVPSQSLLSRVEAALGVEPGVLRVEGLLAQTPVEVRRRLAVLEARSPLGPGDADADPAAAQGAWVGREAGHEAGGGVRGLDRAEGGAAPTRPAAPREPWSEAAWRGGIRRMTSEAWRSHGDDDASADVFGQWTGQPASDDALSADDRALSAEHAGLDSRVVEALLVGWATTGDADAAAEPGHAAADASGSRMVVRLPAAVVGGPNELLGDVIGAWVAGDGLSPVAQAGDVVLARRMAIATVMNARQRGVLGVLAVTQAGDAALEADQAPDADPEPNPDPAAWTFLTGQVRARLSRSRGGSLVVETLRPGLARRETPASRVAAFWRVCAVLRRVSDPEADDGV